MDNEKDRHVHAVAPEVCGPSPSESELDAATEAAQKGGLFDPFVLESLGTIEPADRSDARDARGEYLSSFEEVGRQIGRIVDQKHAAYGDSFGKSGDVMRILYPHGIAPSQMDDALAVVRILDKLFRIATARDAFGESPFGDIAGYGIRGAARGNR